jgi:EAL domain-containing protein (putative c-di-GMP-specific phosphodiesterase class I)
MTIVTVTEPGLTRPDISPDLRTAVEHLCEPGVIAAVVQPVVRPADMSVIGYEALARMPGSPQRPPDWWLDAAAQFGLRQQLELACLAAAAKLGPPPEGRVLFVNASPSTIADPATMNLLHTFPPRLVIELTEQEAVDDYERLRGGLADWLAHGVRVAVDDAGPAIRVFVTSWSCLPTTSSSTADSSAASTKTPIDAP